DYEQVPHLDVARALLLSFVHHEKLAMEVLEKAGSKKLKDFNAPFLLATLMYVQGDNVFDFLAILEGMISTAREQQELITRIRDRCSNHCDADVLTWAPKLMNRAKKAEHLAMNLVAYATAQDVAKGIELSEPLLPLAEEYGDIIKKAAKNPS